MFPNNYLYSPPLGDHNVLCHLYCDLSHLNKILIVDANLQLEEVLEAQGSQIDIVDHDDLNDSPHRYAHGVSDTKA